MKVKQFVIIAFLLGMIVNVVKSEVVCSEDELVREIIEDLEDNGKIYNLIIKESLIA